MNSNTMQQGKATPAEQIKQFCDVLFEPDDLVEVRLLPSGRSTWHDAGTVYEHADNLTSDNADNQNIYIGFNPRARKGRKADAVEQARCLWCDFDYTTPEVALEKCLKKGMPQPTMTTASGHGAHLFWRLIDPIPVTEWSQWQIDLAHTVDSDRSIHDAPRLTRLPGFMNHKNEPAAPCYIVEVHPEATYDLADLHNVIKEALTVSTVTAAAKPKLNGLHQVARATAYAATWEPSEIGCRNNDALRHAAALTNDFALSDDQSWPILAAWNETNTEPLDDAELRTCLANGREYAKQPKANKLTTTTAVATVEARSTDLGNAERLIAQHGDDFRFIAAKGGDSESGTWLHWTGARWEPDVTYETGRAAKRTVRAIYDQALSLSDEEARKKLFAHAIRSENHSRLVAMLHLAKKEPGVAVRSMRLMPIYGTSIAITEQSTCKPEHCESTNGPT